MAVAERLTAVSRQPQSGACNYPEHPLQYQQREIGKHRYQLKEETVNDRNENSK
jgi:hypothetical protein